MALKRRDGGQLGDSRRSVSAIQNAHDVAIHNSTFNVVGGDSHTHHHYHSTNKDLQSLLDAISNFRKIHQDTLAKATPGTITWLFECKEFRLFIDADGLLKILWGSGMPGAGKTILASIVIAGLEALARASNGNICVGYVYIRYSDQDQVTIRSILETLVKQTVERHQDCMPLCEEAYRQHLREGTRPTEEELLELLRLFNNKRRLTFYVLDALDEAPIRLRLKIVWMLSALGARLFITSRPLQDLEAHFPDACTFPIRAHDQDLDLHITQKISESHELQRLINKNGPAFRERLISTVKVRCDGMFLHATLQLDALQDCFTAHDAMETLQAFPNQIEEVYHQTWERIFHPGSPYQSSLALRALAWILYAKRSLTIEQLRHALATCPQTNHYDPARLMPEATIFAACRGLIAADRKSSLVRLVHYTAKAPLEALLLKAFPHPHSLLTAVCITRLADCGFQNIASITWEEELYHILDADPLLKYAYEAWAFHVSQSILVDATAISLAARFIEGCRAFPFGIGNGSVDHHTSLHIVAFNDLPMDLAGPGATQHLNVLTPMLQQTPFHLACSQGCETAAKNLLSLSGVLINPKAWYGYTPLMLACIGGHINIVRLLLAHQDVDFNATMPYTSRTALTLASAHGHANIVQLLLTHPSANANRGYSHALLDALRNGHPIVAKLLLDAPGIIIHEVDDFNNTAINLASENGWEDIVHRVLDFPNIRIDVQDQQSHITMSVAEANGNSKLLRNFEATTAAATHRQAGDDVLEPPRDSWLMHLRRFIS